MKKLLILFAIAAMLFAVGCQKYNDKPLKNRVGELENRVAALEELCKKMNTNISSLQTLVNALQNNDYVTGVTPVTKNGETIGYTIAFSKSAPITIYHGENGKDGINGADGKDGVDGHTPIIGVRQGSDGIYYWTLDGEWLLDEAGNKIKAEGKDGQNGSDGKDGINGSDGKDGQDGANGSDGKDGADGKDGINGSDGKDGANGITPQLKIENGYWFVSTDNGATWINLGKATGEDGDSLFESVIQDEDNVYFTLSDGSIIIIPKQNRKLSLRILDSKNYEFEHAAIVPNQELSLKFETRYQNGGELTNCQVEAFGNGGMSAHIAYNSSSAPIITVSGTISILAGGEVNKYSRVTVIASDGDSCVMKNITFENGELYVSDDAVITVPAGGGEVELNFMTNLDCEVIRSADVFWINDVDHIQYCAVAAQTRVVTIAENNGHARSGEVVVKDKNSNKQISYIINQEASANYLTARAALVDLYNATNGAEWTNNTNWCSEEPINDWKGVICERDGWQVYEIFLRDNNLSGTIPSSIGNLTELERLVLSSNKITGELPASLGNCVKLQLLDLDNNQFVGTLPEEFGNCIDLRSCSLYENNFCGDLPSSIGNLNKVEYMYLQNNNFTSIPEEISGMTALRQLDLSYNKISDIPTGLSMLSENLTALKLNHNALEMEFPVSLCALTALHSLNLGDNKIYGEIPAEIRNLTNLSELSMNQTYLSGKIPDELYDCVNLREINLGHYAFNNLGEPFDNTFIPGYKGLTGEISDKIANLSKLQVLRLVDNDLSGEIPAALVQCTELTSLSLSDNNFTGSLPADIGNLSKLYFLDLSYNNLSGEIPSSFWNLTAMRWLLLSGGTTLNTTPTGQPRNSANLFTGELPEEIGNMVRLQQFYLTGTNMTGALPVAMLDLTNLEDCVLTKNRFSGTLPKSFVDTQWWSKYRILIQQDGYVLTIEE